MYSLISDEAPRDYEGFLLGCLEELRGRDVKGIALVALPEGGETSALTAYWHLGVAGKAEASQHIMFDAADEFILRNVERYKNAAMEEERNEAEEG